MIEEMVHNGMHNRMAETNTYVLFNLAPVIVVTTAVVRHTVRELLPLRVALASCGQGGCKLSQEKRNPSDKAGGNTDG